MKKFFTLLFFLSFGLLFANNTYLNDTHKMACPTATVSYPGEPFCSSINSPQAVVLTGTDNFTGGVFSSSMGLYINSATGAITPSLSTPGFYTVYYNIPSDGTCPSFSTTTTVRILGPSQISLSSSVASTNQTVCPNVAIMNIVYTTTNTTGAIVTGLPPGVTGSYAAGNFTISGTPTVPGVYNYTVTTTGGCLPHAISVGTITVTITPAASVNSSTVCAGTAATVTATPASAGTYTYSWTVPMGAANPGNVASFSTTVGGIYSVMLTNTATNCSGANASGTVTIAPNSDNFSLICSTVSASQINFDWNNVSGITTFNYSYSINGGPTINGSQASPSNLTIINNGQPVTFTISGTGTVCVTPATITCGTLGIDQNDRDNFSVSPNPVTDFLNIRNNQNIDKIIVFNQLGQVVLQKNINSKEASLDFSNLKTGIYFISIDSENKQNSYKIIKQ